jgi:multiple sugar transport system permease protein/sn-glycerol 3-phosphate transport system permease protein
MKHATLRQLEAYLFLFPALATGFIFVILPAAGVLALSLYQWDFMSAPQFVGIDNWRAGIHDAGLIQTLLSTLWIVVLIVPISIVIGLGLALLVSSIDTLKTLFRAFLFAPFVASQVAVSFVWRDLFATQDGLFNYLLNSAGLPSIPWLTSPFWAPISVSIVTIWQQSGYCMLIYLARLQAVNHELYDAAQMDGANGIQTFANVTVPQVSSATFFLVVIGLISGLQLFESVYVITGGGPGYSTTTMVYFIYRVTFQEFNVGSAGVMSVVLLALIAATTLVLWAMQRRIVSYDA